ncbi:MEDS domain-containing protein [Terrabacter sp. BE26]|uniref:MEDS domain-containing protein n=1 Tax=Terrabacter sp. BE26 TaxID=2898152 RepID=UPI0035BE28B7
MNDERASHPHFRHDVLIHDDDAALVDATRRFVRQGLDAGADVLVHGTRSRMVMLEQALTAHPRLTYGYDEQMYVAPSQTLFAYQSQLAGRAPGSRDVWVTGTVPLGATSAAQAAWSRYESAVNEALGSFPFQAMCTYDTRSTPPEVIAAARASHPGLDSGEGSVPCPDYRPPAAFLALPLAKVPQTPREAPQLATDVFGLDDLVSLRGMVRATARSASAVALDAIEDLIVAVHEVTANSVIRGAPPVLVRMWANLTQIVVQVVDDGPGGVDPLAGYRFPDFDGALGLWVARRVVDDLIIDTPRDGGCRILLIKT